MKSILQIEICFNAFSVPIKLKSVYLYMIDVTLIIARYM